MRPVMGLVRRLGAVEAMANQEVETQDRSEESLIRKDSWPFQAAFDSIIGGRDEQQDTALLKQVDAGLMTPALLLVVADGMGGHVGGAVASSLAVQAFGEAFEAATEQPARARLALGLQHANEAIANGIAANPELQGMGSTIVAALQTGRTVEWVSVGDTLLIEIGKGKILRLNEDHSLGAVFDAQAACGEISWDEARNNPRRNMLRSALTGGPIGLTDFGQAALSAGNTLLLATDGILSITDDRLIEIEENSTLPVFLVKQILDEIVQNMQTDQDNTTIAALKIPGGKTKPIIDDAIRHNQLLKRLHLYKKYAKQLCIFGILTLITAVILMKML